MRTISKNQLKTKMLAIFRELEKSGEELIVTDRSRPVLKIVPLKGPNLKEKKKKTFEEVFGPYQGKIKYTGSLTEDTSEEWGDLI